MSRWIVLFAVAAILVSPAVGVSAIVNFTFLGTGGGGGSVSWVGPDTTTALSSMSGFAASFTIGAESWSQSQIFGKYAPPLTDFTVNRPFLRSASTWYFDDGYDGTGDLAIVYFDNGSARLAFDEGDTGNRRYRFTDATGNVTVGNYTTTSSPDNVPEPTALAIWGLFGACGAAVTARRRRK